MDGKLVKQNIKSLFEGYPIALQPRGDIDVFTRRNL